jgi:hypothetical protein
MKVEIALQTKEDQTRTQLHAVYIDTDMISEFYSNRPNGGQAIVIMSNGNKYYTEENVKSLADLCNNK